MSAAGAGLWNWPVVYAEHDDFVVVALMGRDRSHHQSVSLVRRSFYLVFTKKFAVVALNICSKRMNI
jgi:hypothetical protein